MNTYKQTVDYDGFIEEIESLIIEYAKSFEQVIQFESKYYKADKTLFKYNVDLFSTSIKHHCSKKLYVILRNKDDINRSQYEEFIDPFLNNNFYVKPIFLSNIESNISFELDDFVIINNSFCVTAETDEKSQNLTKYHFFEIKESHKKIKRMQNLLSRLKEESFRQENIFRIYEPLSESADINYKTAINHCNNGIMSTGDCRWYHSVWQYLRIIDKVSCPEWHASFYEKCFSKLIKNNSHPKILISGTADYSLLAYFYHSLSISKKNADIFVLDTCQTPLKMCKWYADKQGFNINVIHNNVLNLSSLDNKYDMICSDAFLTRFSKEDANKVVKNWYDVLNENGMIITTVRIRDNNTLTTNRSLKEKYILECVNRFQKWEGYFDITLSEFKDMVEKYITNMVSHDLGNEKNIKEIFERNGLVIDGTTNINDTPGEMNETSYYEICCLKGSKKGE